jgi:hypothetical protein
MKPSVNVFQDVPAGLNRFAGLGGKDYEKIEHFIALLCEVDSFTAHLRRAVARVAGLRFGAHYGTRLPEGPTLPPAAHLPMLIARQFALLAKTPAPRTETEWLEAQKKGDQALPQAARLARRVAALFLSEHWDKLHKCLCRKWFLGRRDAKTCSPACRQKKVELGADFKRRRRNWQLQTKLIPRVEAQLKKVEGLADPSRYRRWEERLRTYRKEVERLKETINQRRR